MGILGTLSVALWLIVRYLHACGEEWTAPAPAAEAGGETEPLTAAKAAPPPLSYGAMEEGTSDSAGRSSSEDLYDGKICVICYDVQRDCFFTPCGHSVTCYPCAKRIMEEEEGRACPICRRLIHKARRLPHY
ncbi:unnamed protein product [Spirodela intermedia]|uniref:RING-type domain-containing protein n=1 Tax=Spirodela intermedia TaxID=51605 RepID=A0A7I8KPI8_SPIIN|nr:unnamed protein product [Spirodela intermedia]